MARSAVLNRVQELWVNLAGVATSFPAFGVRVIVAAESRLCPSAWAGLRVGKLRHRHRAERCYRPVLARIPELDL